MKKSDLLKLNKVIKMAIERDEIYKKKLIPYAKKIKLDINEGNLIKDLNKAIKFEKKKNQLLKGHFKYFFNY